MPPHHALLPRAALVALAEAAASAIATLLRPPGVDKLSGPLRIVTVKVAGSLAARRPRFLGRLLPPLLGLAKAAASQVGLTDVSAGSGNMHGFSVRVTLNIMVIPGCLPLPLLGLAEAAASQVHCTCGGIKILRNSSAVCSLQYRQELQGESQNAFNAVFICTAAVLTGESNYSTRMSQSSSMSKL